MVTATVNGIVIAQSDATKMVEGNHYFPTESIQSEFFTKTDHHTVCHWKGNADYFTLTVDGETHENAAWTYHEPTTDQALPIKDYVAFYPNIVTIATS